MFNYLLPIAGGIFFSVLTIVVLSNKQIDRYHAYFSLFLLSGAVWSVAVGLFLLTDDAHIGRIMVAAFYVAAIMIAYSTLMFARTAPGIGAAKETKKANGLLLFVPIAFMIVWIIATGNFFTEVAVNGLNNTYQLVLEPYLLYALLFVTYIVWALIILSRKYSAATHRTSSQYKSGLKLVAASITFGSGFGAFFNLILPLFGVFTFIWIGPLVVIPTAIIIWYAILRHGLFDVRSIVVRTLGYILSIATLAIVYVALAYVVSLLLLQNSVSSAVSLSPITIVLTLVLALIFQPVKKFFDKITNSIFYRDRYNSEEFIALLGNVLSSTSELRDVLSKAADVIGMTLKSKQAFFVVHYEGHGYVTAGTSGHAYFSNKDIHHLQMMAKSFRGRIVVTDQLQVHNMAHHILSKEHVSLLLPLWHNDEIIGCLALGDALGSQYSRRDLRILETVADELVIAIQNAMSVERVREVNVHLEEKIDNATRSLRRSNEKLKQLDDTKDEFISMASHQLRTPLTSVKGYVSMILDGDAGPISDQQRKFLTEAFDSSNRMAGIIGDFLNVSRLQTGKFSLERESVDLSEIVAAEVKHLKNTARTRGLVLRYHRPETFPVTQLDKSKIEQVVMNFIDNAVFYAPHTGSVDIELFQRSGRAVFTVRDHGIGVPDDEKAHLFTKFFRATNARQKRPDGTGVGLFLAKKVIVAHGGTVIVESREGQGSTFGFEIPITTD